MVQSIWKSMKERVTGKRGSSFYFLLASLVCTVIMLVLYTKTGTNTFTPVLSGKVITHLWVCIGMSVLLGIVEIKNGKYLLYLLSFWTWLEFLVYNASYISNVLVGIDGNLFSVGFLLTAIAGLLSWALALVSAIVQKREVGSQAPDAGQLQAEG